MLVVQLAIAALVAASSVSAQVFNCLGGSVYVVAHPDDDLLFQAPQLQEDMAASLCVTTIFLTSGDAGLDSLDYAENRERGNEASTALMAKVADEWTEFTALFGGQPVLIRTLVGRPGVQKVYFRLPDGNMDGSGYWESGYTSIRNLYFGSISTVVNTYGTARYTWASLQLAVGQILAARVPDHVRTLDHLSDFDAGDHSDHIAVGKLTASLVGTFASNASFAGYMGYPVSNLPPTMSSSSSAYKAKTAAFFAYTPYDYQECQSVSLCASQGRAESYWLLRQYVVTPALRTTSTIGSSLAPIALPAGDNIAGSATVTASSTTSGSAAKAIVDGIISGYPGNETAEWSSAHGGVGSWVKLTWKQPVNITALALYDRPNSNDWWKTGTIKFGSEKELTSFTIATNDGTRSIISLAGSHVVTTILLTVTSVSDSTSNVGLAELQVYGSVCPACATASSTSTSKTSTTKTSTTKASTSTSHSATSSPSLTSTSVSHTSSTSHSSSVTSATGPVATLSGNLIPGSSATVSSGSSGQGAAQAIDGWVDGYKEDGSGIPWEEWATVGERVGARLTITLKTAVQANRLSIYDRPNKADQVTAATVTFDDGYVLKIPALVNDGSETIIDFPQRAVKSLVFLVTGVSSTTDNVGLSDFQMFLVSSASSSSSGITSSGVSSSPSISASSSNSSSSHSATPTSPPSLSTHTSSTTKTSSTSSTSSTAPAPVTTLSANLIQGSSATVSSGSSGQGAAQAIDGWVDGYKEDGLGIPWEEWATVGERVGARLTITLKTSVQANRLSLYDRPNKADQVTAATVTFDDGYVLKIPALVNDGSETTIDFPQRSVKSLVFLVTGVSSTTDNVGLSDFQMFLVSGGSSSSSSASPSSGAATSTGSSSSSSSTSVKPTSVPSSGSHTSSTTKTSSSVSSTAAALAPVTTLSANLIPGSSATVSSGSSGQVAAQAIDGWVDGYKEDGSGIPWEEWATVGERVGARLTITLKAAVQANRLSLYDRPNKADQVTAATVTFDDGYVLKIPALVNDGSETIIDFPQRSVKSLVFLVTGVSSTTDNVGLSDFQMFLVSGGSASSSAVVTSSSTSTLPPVASSSTSSTTSSTQTSSISTTSTSSTILSTTTSSTPTSASSPSTEPPTFSSLGSDSRSSSSTARDTPSSTTPILSSTTSSSSSSPVSSTSSGPSISSKFATSASEVSSSSSSPSTTPTPPPSSSSHTSSTTTKSPSSVSSTSSAAAAVKTLSGNLIPGATAKVSTGSSGQGAAQAIEGWVDGYKEDGSGIPWEEWATVGERVGASLNITLKTAVQANRLSLYDRPNMADQVTAATVTFDDGYVLKIPALANNGTETIIDFPQRAVKTLAFLVTGVSASTESVGLSDFQMFLVSA